MSSESPPRGRQDPVFSHRNGVGGQCQSCGNALFTEVTSELTRLQEENSRLIDDLHKALEVNRVLRERLANRTSNSLAVDNATHAELADRYLDLIAQDLFHLLREHLGAAVMRTAPDRLAREISTVCRDLFLDRRHDPEDLCRRAGLDSRRFVVSMREVARKASELCTRASGAEWVTEVVTGQRLDPATQQAWGQCDPDGEVQFVVVPAYRANGRVYARQQVFTKRRTWWSQRTGGGAEHRTAR